MGLLVRILVVLLLTPIALALLLVGSVAAIVGVPLLWEQLVAKITAPPEQNEDGPAPSA